VVGDIGLEGLCPRSKGSKLGAGALHLGREQIHQDDVEVPLRQGMRAGPPDATGASCHHGKLSHPFGPFDRQWHPQVGRVGCQVARKIHTYPQHWQRIVAPGR